MRAHTQIAEVPKLKRQLILNDTQWQYGTSQLLQKSMVHLFCSGASTVHFKNLTEVRYGQARRFLGGS